MHIKKLKTPNSGFLKKSQKLISILLVIILISTVASSVISKKSIEDKKTTQFKEKLFSNEIQDYQYSNIEVNENLNKEPEPISKNSEESKTIETKTENKLSSFIDTIINKFSQFPLFQKLKDLFEKYKNSKTTDSSKNDENSENNLKIEALDDENVQIVPEEGRIGFIGNGIIILNTTLNFNDTVLVNLQGNLTIFTGVESVDIWWNLTTGFLKINTTSYSQNNDISFTLEDFLIKIMDYNDPSNMISLSIGSLSVNANGFIELHTLSVGSLEFSGVFDLSYFEVMSAGLAIDNLVVSGCLDFSFGVSGDVAIYWDESGFTLDGDIDAYSSDDIQISDFNLHIEEGQSSITVTIGSLMFESGGYLSISQSDGEGYLLFDGVRELDSLSVDLNLVGENDGSLTGTFIFSSSSQTEDLSIYWGSDGFSIDGSYDGNRQLEISDFSLIIGSADLIVQASLISLHRSVEFSFIESGSSTVYCNIFSNNLEILDLYLSYGDFDLTVDSIEVNGSIILELEFSGYVTSEEGHLSVSGGLVMGIDTVISINGTIVELAGVFTVENIGGNVDIWWNKDTGFFKISSGVSCNILDFSISINNNWLAISCDSIVLYPDAFISINEEAAAVNQLRFYGHAMINGLTVTTSELFKPPEYITVGVEFFNDFYLSINSIESYAYGTLDICWGNVSNNETIIINADAEVGLGLALHDIALHFGELSASMDDFYTEGLWNLNCSDGYLNISLYGYMLVTGFAAGSTLGYQVDFYPGESGELGGGTEITVPALEVYYFCMVGTVNLSIGRGVIELWMEGVDACLFMGLAPSQLALEAHGNLHVYLNLVTGEFYGEFGVGGTVSLDGMTVFFSAEGRVYLEGDWLVLDVGVGFHTSIGIYVLFSIDNLRAGASIDVFALGGAFARVYFNLVTGEFYYDFGAQVVVYVGIGGVYALGEDILIDDDDWKELFGRDWNLSGIYNKFVIEVDSLSFLTDGKITAFASAFMDLNGFTYGVGDIDGTINGNVVIRDIRIYNSPDPEYYDQKLPFILTIDSIIANGSVTVNSPDAYNFNIQVEGGGVVNSLGINIQNTTSGGYADLNIGQINLEDLQLDVNMVNFNLVGFFLGNQGPPMYEGSEITIDASGAVSLEDIVIDTEKYAQNDENELFLALSANINIDTIALELGNFHLKYVHNGSNWPESGTIESLLIEGSGTFTMEGFEIEDLTIGETTITGTIDTISFTMGGSLSYFGNGTIVANCDGELTVEGVTLKVGDEELILSELNLELTLELGGHLVIDLQEDGSTVYEFDGDVYFDVDWDIEGEDIIGNGDFTADGNVYLHVENNSDGNITLVDIHLDGTVNMNISFNGFIPGVGNCTIDISNFKGEGMFDFYYDVMKGELYISNFVDTSWDCFSFSMFDGILSADIYEFTGDLRISEIYLNEDLINSCSSYFEALVQILNGNWDLSGALDPDNWIISSYTGYQTLFGFSFSSDNGTNLGGDISYSVFSLKEIYFAPGTKGKFETSIDENGNLRIALTTTEGYAEIEVSIKLSDDLELLLSFNSDKEEFFIPLGDIIRFIDTLYDKEWDELYTDLAKLVDLAWEGKLFSLLILVDKNTENTFLDWLIFSIEMILSQIPSDLLDAFLDLLNQLKDLQEGEESCFLAGTEIKMSDGTTKHIENIEIGDILQSYNPQNGKYETGTVVEVYHHSPEEMTDYYMVINDDLRITPNHPIYLNNEWVTAGELKIGDIYGGNQVTSIDLVYQRVPTYNFKVEPYHTYIVIWGDNTESLVHNAGSSSSETGRGSSSTGSTSSQSEAEDALQTLSSVTGDKSCFLEDTKIKMADDTLKDIEDIQIGDLVKSYNPESETWEPGTVVNVFHHSPEEMTDYYLIINDDLRITPNHPVYINDEFIYAEELKIGDVFGGNLITSIEKVYQCVPTYNFEVEPYHTYIVIWGDNAESLVHNANAQYTSTQQVYTVISDKLGGLTDIENDATQEETGSEATSIDFYCCVTGGTKVTLDDGTKIPIEQVRGGDIVLSYDTQNYKFTYSEVTDVVTPVREGIYEINNGLIKATNDHPFYIHKDNGYTGWAAIDPNHAEQAYNMNFLPLETGDLIYTSNGQWITVNSISYKPGNTQTYSLQTMLYGSSSSGSGVYVEGNYFANDILVHGCSVKADSGLKLHIDDVKSSVDSVEMVPTNYILNEDGGVAVVKVKDDVNMGYDSDGKTYDIYQNEDGSNVLVDGNFINDDEVKEYIKSNNDLTDVIIGNQPIEDDDDDDTCCFPAGTMISMADNTLKAIENIEIGEYVLSYDTKLQRFTSCKVLETVNPVRNGVYKINDGLVYPTDDHPFYVRKPDGTLGWAAINPELTKKGYEMTAMQLEICDELFSSDGEWIRIYSIEYIPGSIQTFNLEDVSGKSNFFANGFLVHNAVACEEETAASNKKDVFSVLNYENNLLFNNNILSFDTNNIYYSSEGLQNIDFPVGFDGSGTYQSACFLSGTKIAVAARDSSGGSNDDGDSGSQDKLFNLEIQGYNTFFANDVLVNDRNTYVNNNPYNNDNQDHNEKDEDEHLKETMCSSSSGLLSGTKIAVAIPLSLADEISEAEERERRENNGISSDNNIRWIYKNIEDIQVGDLVKAYDQVNKCIVETEVTKISSFNVDGDYLIIRFSKQMDSALNSENVLEVAFKHNLYVFDETRNSYNWVSACDLHVGDTLFSIDGEKIIVTSIFIGDEHAQKEYSSNQGDSGLSNSYLYDFDLTEEEKRAREEDGSKDVDVQNKPNENEVEWIYKNIEDIQPGDLVKAYDPLTKRMVDLPVTELDTHNFDEFINGETTGFAIEADPNNVISYLVINCVPESSLNDDTSNSGSENPYVKNSDDDPLIKTYSLRASIYSTFFGNIEDGPRIIDDDNNDRSGDNNDNSGSSDYPDMVTLKVTPNHPIWVSYTSEESEDYGGSQPTNKKQEMEDGQKIPGWVPAGEIKCGDSLVGINGERLVVTSINSGGFSAGASSQSYNVQVAGYHTYFANGVLVSDKQLPVDTLDDDLYAEPLPDEEPPAIPPDTTPTPVTNPENPTPVDNPVDPGNNPIDPGNENPTPVGGTGQGGTNVNTLRMSSVDYTSNSFNEGTTASNDDNIVLYIWDFGDGTLGFGQKPTHTYHLTAIPLSDYNTGNNYANDDSAESRGLFATYETFSNTPITVEDNTVTYPVTLYVVDKYGVISLDKTEVKLSTDSDKVLIPVSPPSDEPVTNSDDNIPSSNPSNDPQSDIPSPNPSSEIDKSRISYKNIEDIEIGDTVVSYDEVNEVFVTTTVTKISNYNIGQEGYYIKLKLKQVNQPDNSPIAYSILHVAPDQTVYMIDNENTNSGVEPYSYKIISADNVKTGDKLFDLDGEIVEVISIEKIYESATTYNLEVENNHNYFANDILVNDRNIENTLISNSDNSDDDELDSKRINPIAKLIDRILEKFPQLAKLLESIPIFNKALGLRDDNSESYDTGFLAGTIIAVLENDYEIQSIENSGHNLCRLSFQAF